MKPVEVSFTPLASGDEFVKYTITSNSDKPVTQVDIGVRYLDDGGGEVDATTYAWQNIEGGSAKPLVKGKAYQDESYLTPGTTKVEWKLLRVLYADGTRWENG